MTSQGLYVRFLRSTFSPTRAALVQIEIKAESLRQVDLGRRQGHLGPVSQPDEAFNKVGVVSEEHYPSAADTDLGSTVVPKGERPQSISAPLVQAAGRRLQSADFCVTFDAAISQCTATLLVSQMSLVVVDITGAVLAELLFPTVVLETGVAIDLTADILDNALLNDEKNGFCDGCIIQLGRDISDCTVEDNVVISNLIVSNRIG